MGRKAQRRIRHLPRTSPEDLGRGVATLETIGEVRIRDQTVRPRLGMGRIVTGMLMMALEIGSDTATGAFRSR